MTDSITVAKLEDDILIWSWGQWARSSGDMVTKYPGWVVLMLQGYREARAKLYPDIDDDYALKIDRIVSSLPELQRGVVYLMYVCRCSANGIARIQRRSRAAVAQDRDSALWYVYGALSAESQKNNSKSVA